jgi:hypothetical protein
LNIGSVHGFHHTIQGQLLRRSKRREVAIFLRDGTLWVADFFDGVGMLVDARAWLRFNCGGFRSPHAEQRMVLESAIPLSEELIAKIGRLNFPTITREPGRVRRLINTIVACTVCRSLRIAVGRPGTTHRLLNRLLQGSGSTPQHLEGQEHVN